MLGPVLDRPCVANRFQEDFIARVVEAFRVTGGDLVAEAGLDPTALGESAWFGDFALLTHRGGADAILNYGNLYVQRLWACDWQTLTRMPSRETAPEEGREARAALMARAMAQGFVLGYGGERVATDGRRFFIRDAVIWRLVDMGGDFGVAAFFRRTDPS